MFLVSDIVILCAEVISHSFVFRQSLSTCFSTCLSPTDHTMKNEEYYARQKDTNHIALFREDEREVSRFVRRL